jgi:hypothetical protein
MSDVNLLNPLAQRAWTTFIAAYPEWAEYFGTSGEGDLEAAVPAPTGSKAGHLVIFTAKGENLWIRFSPPSMCYSVDDEAEMVTVVRQLVEEKVLFVVVMSGDEWAGTTLARRGEPSDLPQLEPNQVAHVVSWSGKYDQTITARNSAGTDRVDV